MYDSTSVKLICVHTGKCKIKVTTHGLQYILRRQIDKFENLYDLLKCIAQIQDDIVVRSIIIRSTEKFLSSSYINTDKGDFLQIEWC